MERRLADLLAASSRSEMEIEGSVPTVVVPIVPAQSSLFGFSGLVGSPGYK
jgi:hypothetical protein